LLYPGYRLDLLLLRRACRIVAVSRSIRDRIAADGLPNPERVAVIPNGIDVSFYENHADRESARREFGVTANEILVGTAGRLAWVKNQALFLQACAGVFARMPQIKAVLVGDGPEEGNLRRLAKKLGIGENVIFAGWRNDLPRCLSALDIFVLSSRSEVAPWVLLESMALGVPVISTNVGGVPEMVENGRTGLLVPTEDAQSLAQAILSLASFPTDRNQMAGRGKDFVKDHLTEDRMLRAISDIYLSAFRENPKTPSRRGGG
jgi:glycosyltransferase involved in cell wall biosynthesis